MSFDITPLVHPGVLSLQPYQSGKAITECQREYGIDHFVRLSSNENPLGMSPKVQAALNDAIAECAAYPDCHAYDLKKALSQHLQVDPQQLILGNGSEEIIKMLMQVFLLHDKEVLIPEYAFIAYKLAAKSLNLPFREIPHKNYGVDVDGILNTLTDKTRMVILANPCNPTGCYLPTAEFERLLKALPSHVLLVCDEAYYEYVLEADYPQTLSYLKDYPHLIITRTFSKAYGLAGVRVGYAIAHPDIAELVNRIRLPFNVNVLAQKAAIAALSDQEFVRKTVLTNEAGKRQLMAGLAELGLEYFPSFGNYLLVKLNGPGKDLFEALLKEGIITRPLVPYGLINYLRISIGLESENAACLAALSKILARGAK